MFFGAAGPTPRGIDRVDMGYASCFFADPDTPNVGLVPLLGPARMGVLSGAETRALAGVVDKHWRDGAEQNHLSNAGAAERKQYSRRATVGRYLRMVGHARWAGFRNARR